MAACECRHTVLQMAAQLHTICHMQKSWKLRQNLSLGLMP